MKLLKTTILSISVLLSLLFAFQAEGAEVRLRIEPQRGKRTIEVGDRFYIMYVVSDMDGAPEKPTNVPGASILYFERTGQSSSYSSVNGKVTQSFSYTYTATLKAVKEGSYTFGPVSVGSVKSNTISYNIGGAAAPNGAAPSQNGAPGSNKAAGADSDKPTYIGKGDANLFLRANVSKASVFEQEALVYTVKLYTTYDAIKFIGATAAPKFDGFVVEESKDISNSLSYETYQGKTYATAIIARYIIFPQMTGQLKITGNTYTVSVDRREYFHDSFFGTMSYSTPLQLNVTPNDLQVNVKALPSPRPADFSGGVGSFSIKSDLTTKEFKSNQAASIVYTVKGTGNLKYIQLPDLQALYPSELEVYSPETKQSVKVGSSDVSGEVSFDYSFMPLEEGSYKIPDVKLVYFNPATGNYETSVAKGYEITVGKGAAVANDNAARVARFSSKLAAVNPSDLTRPARPWIYSFGYWLFYIVPVVLLVGFLIAYRRYVSLHSDMIAFNSRRADKLARRRLKRARQALKLGDSDLFETELLKALWGYMADKLKMPTSELLRDNIRQVLTDRGIPEEDIQSFVGLLDDVEFNKYSSAADRKDMPGLYNKAIEVINSLESDFKFSKK